MLVCSACHAQSTYVGWNVSRPEFNQVETTLSGPLIGWNYALHDDKSTFAELGYQRNGADSLQLSSIRSGLLGPTISAGQLDLRGRMDFGYSVARFVLFENSNSLFSFGLSIQPTLHLTDDLALTGLIGYRFYYDQTRKRRCADGSHADGEGAATCLDHGGIEEDYPDRIGDAHGPEFTIGILYRH